jgi:hypothetical protein
MRRSIAFSTRGIDNVLARHRREVRAILPVQGANPLVVCASATEVTAGGQEQSPPAELIPDKSPPGGAMLGLSNCQRANP